MNSTSVILKAHEQVTAWQRPDYSVLTCGNFQFITITCRLIVLKTNASLVYESIHVHESTEQLIHMTLVCFSLK